MKPTAFAGLRLPVRIDDDFAVPFEITCDCGQVLQGERQARYQVLPCPSCAAKRFILPRSPLPAVLGTKDGIAVAARPRWLFWAGPLLAAGLALVLALAGIILLIQHAASNRSNSLAEKLTDDERLQRHLAVGHAALAEGSFHRASSELAAALDLGDRMPGHWKTAERRQVAQLQRQAALLSDLLSDSLEDIVQQSIGMNEAEWQEQWQHRYAHRSFLIDAVIHREHDGPLQMNHRLRVAGAAVRIDLNRLSLLNSIALTGPQRMLLGMRLADLRRNGAGWWIVPEADSGVLITDREVIAGLSLPNAAEYEEVLRRQQGLLP